MKKRNFKNNSAEAADAFEWDLADTACDKPSTQQATGAAHPHARKKPTQGFMKDWHIIADEGNPPAGGRYIVTRQNPKTGSKTTSTKIFSTVSGWAGHHNVLAWAELPDPPQGI